MSAASLSTARRTPSLVTISEGGASVGSPAKNRALKGRTKKTSWARTKARASTAAILIIALGVGANLAVFALTYGILWRLLPNPDASRLVLFSIAVR